MQGCIQSIFTIRILKKTV